VKGLAEYLPFLGENTTDIKQIAWSDPNCQAVFALIFIIRPRLHLYLGRLQIAFFSVSDEHQEQGAE
jgi:hypothetical protein